MVNQTVRTNVAASTTEANVFEGTKLENVPTDANYLVRVFATASSFDVEHEIEADTDVLIQQGIVGDTDRRPQDPEDFLGEFPVTGGSKLFCKVVNNDGTNAQDHTIRVELVPMG
jgi:hypothetical protein